jgi:hypothetical protein
MRVRVLVNAQPVLSEDCNAFSFGFSWERFDPKDPAWRWLPSPLRTLLRAATDALKSKGAAVSSWQFARGVPRVQVFWARAGKLERTIPLNSGDEVTVLFGGSA